MPFATIRLIPTFSPSDFEVFKREFATDGGLPLHSKDEFVEVLSRMQCLGLPMDDVEIELEAAPDAKVWAEIQEAEVDEGTMWPGRWGRRKIVQINNLQVWHYPENPEHREFVVLQPPSLSTSGKRQMWEEFATAEAAKEFCRETTDFVRGRGGAR